MMHTKTRICKFRSSITLLLAVMAVGCASTVRDLPSPSPTPTPTLTATVEASATPETLAAGTVGNLVSRHVASPPEVNGHADAAWAESVPLQLSLTWGLDGTEHALDMELQSLHTGEAVYFRAMWPGEPPSGEENTVFNRVTVHWRITESEEAAKGLACTVACHTAFTDGRGRFVYANAETIPQGGYEALPVAGGWSAGTWTLEWSRPLVNGNPFDLQFTDLDQTYPFLVKLFERIEGRPDPVSERYGLVFQP